MDDQVPKEVVQERFDRLVALQERISGQKAAALLGTTLEVLVEGGDRAGRSTQARTRTNRIVHLPDVLEPGSFVMARIVATAPHHLTGELVREPAAASG
jgi:tRNA-2-methylthio-N6-dimethylallyladenosine synthase